MMKKKIMSVLTVVVLLFSHIGCFHVSAESVPIVTIGADLDDDERNMIYDFFGVDRNSIQTIEINNEQERQYLSGLISDEIIGTHTISCSYIMPTTSGGLFVKTANLTYIDENMIANALLTSGVENCQVLATAPFKVSGTGALTGIFASYEIAADTVLEDEKKRLATKELVVTGEIISEIINKTDDDSEYESYKSDEINFFRFINELKSISVNSNMDRDEIFNNIEVLKENYNISLSDNTNEKLAEFLEDFSGSSYESDFNNNLNSLTKTMEEGFDVNKIKESMDDNNRVINYDPEKIGFVKRFFMNLSNWLQYIFSISKADFSGESLKENIKDDITSIFDNINTDIIGYDIDSE